MDAFRYAARSLYRHRGFVALNVAGLALGLSAAAVLLLFARHETAHDAFHAHADRIGLLAARSAPNGDALVTTQLPPTIGPLLVEGAPNVERAVRVLRAGPLQVRRDGVTELIDVDLAFVDPEVFDVFSLPFRAGHPARALAEPNGLVLDEDLATAWFEDATTALGRELEVEGTALRITGVMARVPRAAHWRPRLLLPLDGAFEHVRWTLREDVFAFRTYLLFREGAPLSAEGFGPLLAPHRAGATFNEWGVQPLRRIHLHGSSPWGTDGGPARLVEADRLARLRVFTALAGLLLLLAGFNYVTLATAYGLRRAREVGVRKTLGAGRAEVARLFLAEAILVALAAGAIALLLVPLAVPSFGEAVDAELAFVPWREPGWAAALLGLAAATGALAGLYPALALSRPAPALLFRNGPGRVGGLGVRRALVALQLAASVALAAATLTMGRQLVHLQGEHLGLQPEQVLAIDLGTARDGRPGPALRDRLGAHPAVRDLATATFTPGGWGAGFSSFRIDDQTHYLYDPEVDPSFRRVLGLTLLAGTDLPAGPFSDDALPVLINASAAAVVGWTPEEAIGRRFPFPENREVVVGVVRDFRYGNPRDAIGPARLRPLPDGHAGRVLLVRFAPEDAGAILDATRRAWAEVAPEAPLRTRFLDEGFADLFRAERRLARLFAGFAVVALGIAATGLFGLAAYTAERRRREIALRKAVGARTGALLILLLREYAGLAAVGFALGALVAAWALQRWLESYALRVPLEPGVFALAGLLALVVLFAAVATPTLRAATADSVRYLAAE